MTDKSIMDAVLAPQKEVPALKIVGEVSVLKVLAPTDVIILKVDSPVSAAEVERLIVQWKQASALPNNVVCLVQGVDVSVMRPGVNANG